MHTKQQKGKQTIGQSPILDKNQAQKLQKQFEDILSYQPKPRMKQSIINIAKNILPISYYDMKGMGRLLSYIDTQKAIAGHSQIQKLMVGYSAIFFALFIASVTIPKKIISKAVTSLMVFGVKSQITDYYVMVQGLKTVAVSDKMTKQQQQIRNILQYFYDKKKRETMAKLGVENQDAFNEDPTMLKIKQQTRKYYLYVQNKDLL